jgi:hypothetical protein
VAELTSIVLLGRSPAITGTVQVSAGHAGGLELGRRP